jgi:hypothetical protein
MKFLKKLYLFATGPEGRKDIGAVCGAVSALYIALHKAGVL